MTRLTDTVMCVYTYRVGGVHVMANAEIIRRVDCFTRREAAEVLGVAPNSITVMASPSRKSGKLEQAPRELWDSERAMLVLKSSVMDYKARRRPHSQGSAEYLERFVDRTFHKNRKARVIYGESETDH